MPVLVMTMMLVLASCRFSTDRYGTSRCFMLFGELSDGNRSSGIEVAAICRPKCITCQSRSGII